MGKSVTSHFYSGTSGLVLPIPKYEFPAPYENASRLTYYATLFNSLEVNSSFYKIPKLSTTYKWATSVPDDFRFTFKLWQGITHEKELEFKKEDVERFMTIISEVGIRKGCLLIQLPPGIGNQYFGKLEKLLETVREVDRVNWKIAVEFRNHSWYNDATFALLNSFKAALVIHDMPGSATPPAIHTSDFMYVRFHGPTGKYDGSYTEEYLNECAIHIHAWISQGKEVFVYFNNTIGDALQNLNDLNSLVQTKQQNNA